jgi:hypothetical protein
MLRWDFHKSAPSFIESFGYVFPAALVHASAMGAKARCEIVSASVTFRQMRFMGIPTFTSGIGYKQARLKYRLVEGNSRTRDREPTPHDRQSMST